MMFDRYTQQGIAGAVALINGFTPGWKGGRPLQAPSAMPPGAVAADPFWSRPETSLSGAAALAAALRPVFTAAAGGDPSAVVDRLNALLDRYRPWPVFSADDPPRFHFHAASDQALDNHAVGYVIALCTAVSHGAAPRLGVCSADRCDRVFVDGSRNAARRFCSQACMTRTKVAALRAARSREHLVPMRLPAKAPRGGPETG